MKDRFSSDAYRTLGDERVAREFTVAHCRNLAQWFDSHGRFIHYGTKPGSRERMWNCLSLLRHGAPQYRRLAEQIIVETPIDGCGFLGTSAIEVWLRHRRQLSRRATDHLRQTVRENLLNLMEIRFGGPGINNFACMTTWFLLAASRVLDGYEFKHRFAGPPYVYLPNRLRAMGLNALRALAHHAEHEPVSAEFNSPTYSPISVHSMAKIVDLMGDDPEVRDLALQVEGYLWHELLALYHPHLGLSCGPFSRAYRIDILGQTSQMRVLLAYLGLSKDRSVVDLFNETQPGMVFHHDGDLPFVWSGPAWQIAGKFHVPVDALAELRRRRFPKRFESEIYWDAFGQIDPRTHRYQPVQGNLFPAGKGRMVQIQKKRWALGYRTPTRFGHGFPIQFHYPVRAEVRTMRDVRNVTAAVMFHGAPMEWVPDQKGQPMEAGNFSNAGTVQVVEKNGVLHFTAQPLLELAPLAADEISLNTFIPLHFGPVKSVSLNGVTYAGSPLDLRSRRAVCRVHDAETVYEIAYEFPRPVEIRLYHWAHFIRFGGFFYRGPSRRLNPSVLKKITVRGTFRIVRAP